MWRGHFFYLKYPTKKPSECPYSEGGIPPLEMEADSMTTNIKIPSIPFIVTMDIAYKHLEKGVISINEYQKFLEQMADKYKDENTRILYQSKLAIYQDQSD